MARYGRATAPGKGITPPDLTTMPFTADAYLRAQAALAIHEGEAKRHPAPHLYGAALDLQTEHQPEILIEGPAGTGKSIACLYKLHVACLAKAGTRCLIIRKTRESLSEAALFTYEVHVLGGTNHPIVRNRTRNFRQAYRYPNGSSITVGGIDKPGKIMSTEYDLVYVQEATELSETDWESLTTRIRNRVNPIQQLMGDCNPDAPTHWLNKRCDTTATKRLISRHEDNPTLYDHEAGAWTPAGVDYIDRLDRLTGVRKERLRYGRWAAAEGAVYEEYDARIHLIDKIPGYAEGEVPYHWRKIRVIDFGYQNPFVCQWWAMDGDGAMYLYRQVYRSQRLVELWADDIKALSVGESIETTVADHDAEGRATLEAHGVPTQPALKSIQVGIQHVAARLHHNEGKVRPTLFILKNCLVAPNEGLPRQDERMEEAHRPWSTEQEFDSYIWPKGQDGKPVKEVPVKADDHGLDALRYAVMYVDGAAGVIEALDPDLVEQLQNFVGV